MKIQSLLLAVSLSLVSFSASAETVNLNKANAAALSHYLYGVGDKRAKEIVKYRKSHKKFKKIAEIKEVNGIGDTIFDKIKSSLSLTKGVTSAPAKIAKKVKKVSSKKKTMLKKVKKAK
jgi:competence protein ComEA